MQLGCRGRTYIRTYIDKVVMSIYRPVLLRGTTFLWPADKRATTDKCKYVTIKKGEEKKDKYLRSKVNIVRRVPCRSSCSRWKLRLGNLARFSLFPGNGRPPRYMSLDYTWSCCYIIRFGLIAILNALNRFSSQIRWRMLWKYVIAENLKFSYIQLE